MSAKIRVLFLCTGNCFRSQMAEAILRHRGGERFEAFSAGWQPAGYIHPLAVRALEERGVPVSPQVRSKDWDEFADEPMDLVVTLCDRAAQETCPVWADAPLQVHWPLPDPVAAFSDEDQVLEFSRQVACRLEKKIERLIKMDWPAMSVRRRCRSLEQIARL